MAIHINTLNGGNITRSISITQEGNNPYLSVSPSSVEFESTGGSKTCTISSNVSWTVSSNQNWCTVNRTSGSNDGTITITATSGNAATATVTIKGGGITRNVSVTRKAKVPGEDDNPLPQYSRKK